MMRKTKYLYVIFAAAVFACLAPAALAADGIVIERSFDDSVAAGETFEVTLSVDISEENKPVIYILTENVPGGFEIVDTDAKVNDNETNKMVWLAIEDLLGGKVEDTVYVYHLRAPDTIGEYEISGDVLLKDKNRYKTEGKTLIHVAEAGSVDGKDSGKLYDVGIIHYVAIILIIISAAVLYTRKSTARLPKTGNVKKETGNVKK